MKDIKSLLLAVLGIVLFIILLPTLMWLAFIVIILVVIFAVYMRVKYNRFMKNAQDQFTRYDNQEYGFKGTPVNDDVIDVEYSEKEDPYD